MFRVTGFDPGKMTFVRFLATINELPLLMHRMGMAALTDTQRAYYKAREKQ